MLTKANPSSRDKGAAAQLHPPTLCKIPENSTNRASSFFGLGDEVVDDDFEVSSPQGRLPETMVLKGGHETTGH